MGTISKVAHRETFKFNMITAKNLYNKDLPPVGYLVDKLICEESLIYVTGPSGSFKTGFMLFVSILGACRNNVLGFKVNKPLKVLFIDEENGIRRTKHKFKRIIDATDIDVDKELCNDEIVFLSVSQFKIKKDHVEALIEIIKKHEPNLVVIDNIARCFVGSERDEQEVSKIHYLLKPIQERYGVSFVIIHHTRKGDIKNKNPRTLDDISGSRDFGAQCDEAFLLEKYKKVDDRTTKFKLVQLKAKDNLEMDAINFSVSGADLSPLEITYDGLIKDNILDLKREIAAKILEWWKDGQQKTLKTSYIIEEMKKLSYSKTYVRHALKIMKDGRILSYKYGEYTLLDGDEKC